MEEIKELLQSIHPFDNLDEVTLETLANHTDIGYYKKGEVIVEFEEVPKAFFLIFKGKVLQLDKEENIVEIYEDHDSFDAQILLEAKNPYRFITDEETITYEISKDAFLEAFNHSLELKNYLLKGIAHKIKKLRQLRSSQEAGAFLSAKVSDMILNKAIIIPSTTSIKEATQTLSNTKSEIIILKSDQELGVLTYKDLKEVILKEIPLHKPAEEIGSFPAISIDKEDFLFNALLKMTNYGIKHLVVTKENKAVATLEITEILSYFSNQSYLLAQRIQKARSIEELQKISESFINVIKILYHKGIKIRHLAKLMDELHKKLYSKLFEITFPTELQKACTLLLLGSEGRGEQLLRTDQDNALLLKEYLKDKEVAPYAKEFTEHLLTLGYPECPGGVMVSNSYWRRDEKGFKELILSWIERFSEEDQLHLSIFFDAKSLQESCELQSLKELIFTLIKDKRSLLAHLAKATLSFDTALGLFNTFKEKSVDLKKSGIFPVVHGVRVLAMEYEIYTTNTIQRIKELNEKRVLDTTFAKDLVEAFDTLQSFRLKASLESIQKSGKSTNMIELDNLSKIEKDTLKDSLKIVNDFKKFIKFHFRLDMVS